MDTYEEKAKIFKALSNPNRLKIIDILACGERCACVLLEHFDFTQPTLSHHMKVLADLDLVKVRKEGIWNYYSPNTDKYEEISDYIYGIFHETEDGICSRLDLPRKVEIKI